MPVSILSHTPLTGPVRADRTAPLRQAFRVDITGREVVRYRRWRVAQDSILRALTAPGLVVLVGPAGTGKTLMLEAIAHLLRAAGRDVALLPGVRAAKPMADPAYSAGADVLLIDDADDLSEASLASLVRPKPLCLLAGSDNLPARLNVLGCAITLITLAPLDAADVALFLAEQLDLAGQPSDLFEPAAVTALAQQSGGVQRTLQMLAGLSVFIARLEDAACVSAAHVASAGLVGDGTDLYGTSRDSDEIAADQEDELYPRAPDIANFYEDETRDGETAWSLPVATVITTPPRPAHRPRIAAASVLAVLVLGMMLVGARVVEEGRIERPLLQSAVPAMATAPSAPASSFVPQLPAPAPPAPTRAAVSRLVMPEANTERRAEFEAALRNRRGFVPVPVLRENLDGGNLPSGPTP